MTLVIVGWVAILLITAYLLFSSFAIFVGGLGLTGKVPGEFYFFVVLTGLMVWLCYHTWPFEVAIKATQ